MSLKALMLLALIGVHLSSVKFIEASQQSATTPPPEAQASQDIQKLQKTVKPTAEVAGTNSKQPSVPSSTINGNNEQNRQHTLIDESTSSTNQQALVFNNEAGLGSGQHLFDTADALLTSHSMPAGKRRLDTFPQDIIASQASSLPGSQQHLSDRLAILDLPNVDPSAFYRPDTLLAEAAANRERRKSKYSEIVDNGPSASGPELGLHQLELAAARNNRLAMASAMQYQKMAARKLRNQVMRPTGAATSAAESGEQFGRQQQHQSNKRSWAQARAFRGAGIARQESRKRVGGMTRGRQQQQQQRHSSKRGGADEWNEYDELNSRSDRGNDDGDDENDADSDDGSSSYRRRSGDESSSVFDELESSSSGKSRRGEEADVDEDDDDAGAATGRERASRRAHSERGASDDDSADDQYWNQGRQLRQASSSQIIGSNSPQLASGRGGRGERMRRKQGGAQSRAGAASGGDDSEDDDNAGANSMNLRNLRGAEHRQMNGGRNLRHATTQLYANRRQSGPVYGNQKTRLDWDNVNENGNNDNNVNDNSNYFSSSLERRSYEQHRPQKQFGALPLINDNDNNENNNNDDYNYGNNNGNLVDGNDSDLSASHVVRHSANDLQTAAGYNHGHHHGYYQYVEVPKKKAWKFGLKRGNHKHTIEKHEKGYKNKFHTTFKWHAKEKCKKKSKCESVGKMSWDYKHHDKKHP